MGMSNHEKMSALIDNELNDDQLDALIDQISEQPELKQQWASFHLTGDAIRNELTDVSSSSLLGRINAELDAQEVSPLQDQPLPQADTSKVIRPKVAKWGMAKVVQGIAGLAIAASVAALSVVGVRWLQPVEQIGTPQLVEKVPQATNALPNLDQQGLQLVKQPAANLPPEIEAKLQNNLRNHARQQVDGDKNAAPYSPVLTQESGQ
ncbi:sigma-E factor negative regulatory protein [Pelagibaculum spongiae]|nr:sigma-E factor negative regulatory protein [Pelagibaculum spongiae]